MRIIKKMRRKIMAMNHDIELINNFIYEQLFLCV